MKNIRIVVEIAEQEVLVQVQNADCSQEDPARIMEKAMLPHDLEMVLAKIGEREAKIIKMHWGLNGKEPITLKDIGKKMKLSGCRVQQLEERALLRLRRMAARMGLIEVSIRSSHPDLQPGWVVKK